MSDEQQRQLEKTLAVALTQVVTAVVYHANGPTQRDLLGACDALDQYDRTKPCGKRQQAIKQLRLAIKHRGM